MLLEAPIHNLCDSEVFTLRSAERIAAAGRVLALCALALLAWTTFQPLEGTDQALVASIGLAALLAGAVLSAWVNRAELRFDGPRLLQVTGAGPLLRRRETDLRGADAVIVTWRERTDWSGQALSVATLGVRLGKGMLPLLRSCRDEQIEVTAAAIADRLRAPLLIEKAPPAVVKPGRNASRLITMLLWGGLLAVTGIMLKPLFTPRSGLPALLAEPRSPAGYRAYQEGLNLFSAGRYADAEAMLAQATRESSHDPEALNMLAYAQAEQNKLDQALATAEAALKAARGSANIIDTVGEMHERRREFTKAESYYADALSRMSPFESCETHTKLARTLIALHRPAAAIPHLNMALRYPQQPWADLAAHLLRSIAPGREVPAPVAPFSRGIAPR